MDVPSYNSQTIIDEAESKLQSEGVQSAQKVYQSALLEWVDDVTMDDGGAIQTDRVKEEIAKLWLAYANLNKRNNLVSCVFVRPSAISVSASESACWAATGRPSSTGFVRHAEIVRLVGYSFCALWQYNLLRDLTYTRRRIVANTSLLPEDIVVVVRSNTDYSPCSHLYRTSRLQRCMIRQPGVQFPVKWWIFGLTLRAFSKSAPGLRWLKNFTFALLSGTSGADQPLRIPPINKLCGMDFSE